MFVPILTVTLEKRQLSLIKRFDRKGKVNKREVNNIMKKMKQEAKEFKNNPFAELLGKMNLKE